MTRSSASSDLILRSFASTDSEYRPKIAPEEPIEIELVGRYQRLKMLERTPQMKNEPISARFPKSSSTILPNTKSKNMLFIRCVGLACKKRAVKSCHILVSL
mmetsp:Transcript_18028/g.26701  ORF Transcript_18028/g.26701 Transcript_18028/m.26701 type:complete len:102 (-) Transcript_18028:372-677(-)